MQATQTPILELSPTYLLKSGGWKYKVSIGDIWIVEYEFVNGRLVEKWKANLCKDELKGKIVIKLSKNTKEPQMILHFGVEVAAADDPQRFYKFSFISYRPN